MSCNGRGIFHIQGGHFISSRPGEGGTIVYFISPAQSEDVSFWKRCIGQRGY